MPDFSRTSESPKSVTISYGFGIHDFSYPHSGRSTAVALAAYPWEARNQEVPARISNLTERLRRRRTDLGFTQATLAERRDLATRAVADRESGATKPLGSSWAVIAEVLGSDLVSEGAEIGSRVRAARWRLRLTQTELADKVGLNPRTIRNTEQGRYRSSRATLAKLGAVIHLVPCDSVEDPVDPNALRETCPTRWS